MTDFYLATRNSPYFTQTGLGSGEYVFGEGSNDIFLDGDRDLMMVGGVSKLQQDIIKSLFTARYTNTVYPIFGSTIRDVIGTKADLTVIRADIRSKVIDALKVQQFINSDNPNLDEQIETIDIIKVTLNEPTEIKIEVQVTTVSGKVVNAIALVG